MGQGAESAKRAGSLSWAADGSTPRRPAGKASKQAAEEVKSSGSQQILNRIRLQMGDGPGDNCTKGLEHTVILLRHGESQWNSDNR